MKNKYRGNSCSMHDDVRSIICEIYIETPQTKVTQDTGVDGRIILKLVLNAA